MPIMTLNDRLVLIESHLNSIKRALKRGDEDSLSTVGQFLNSIAEVAREGSDIALTASGEAPPGGAT